MGEAGGENGMSESARNVLSSFLAHTGTETDKFCVVLATNVKDVLDRAVMDRVDERFLFPLPGADERKTMVNMFFDKYLRQPTKTNSVLTIDPAIDDAYLAQCADRMEGFSGRQISKTILGMQAAVFGSGTNSLSKNLADAVLDWKIANIEEDDDTIERKQAEKLKEQAKDLGTY